MMLIYHGKKHFDVTLKEKLAVKKWKKIVVKPAGHGVAEPEQFLVF